MRLVRSWDVAAPAGIARVRREVADILSSGGPGHPGRSDAAADRVWMPEGGLVELRNRVALSCSELVTNALRHGRPPIAVRLLTDGAAWILDVTDAATDRLPDPYPDRPLGQGGYGLLLVARLASHLGWYVGDDAKHVWARIEATPDDDLVDELTAR